MRRPPAPLRRVFEVSEVERTPSAARVFDVLQWKRACAVVFIGSSGAISSVSPCAASAMPRNTKYYQGKLQTEIEDMHLPNPVIRSHYGNGFIKQYVRDHLLLRT